MRLVWEVYYAAYATLYNNNSSSNNRSCSVVVVFVDIQLRFYCVKHFILVREPPTLSVADTLCVWVNAGGWFATATLKHQTAISSVLFECFKFISAVCVCAHLFVYDCICIVCRKRESCLLRSMDSADNIWCYWFCVVPTMWYSSTRKLNSGNSIFPADRRRAWSHKLSQRSEEATFM